MGMWGMGIFANDSALDFLDEVASDFARRISAALGMELQDNEAIAVKPLEQVELADLDHIVLPSAAILIRLCSGNTGGPSREADIEVMAGLLEQVGAQTASARRSEADGSHTPDPISVWSATPPAANVIRAWRERSLAAFAANIRSDLTSADYREGRPVVIKLTFDQLEAIASAAEQW